MYYIIVATMLNIFSQGFEQDDEEVLQHRSRLPSISEMSDTSGAGAGAGAGAGRSPARTPPVSASSTEAQLANLKSEVRM